MEGHSLPLELWPKVHSTGILLIDTLWPHKPEDRRSPRPLGLLLKHYDVMLLMNPRPPLAGELSFVFNEHRTIGGLL